MFLFLANSIINDRKKEVFMRFLRILSYILVIIGALNWGLIGFMNLDIVALIFGEMTTASIIIYSLVGIGAVISLLTTCKYVFYRCDV